MELWNGVEEGYHETSHVSPNSPIGALIWHSFFIVRMRLYDYWWFTDNLNQEGILIFRMNLVEEIIFSPTNHIEESKEAVEGIMQECNPLKKNTYWYWTQSGLFWWLGFRLSVEVWNYVLLNSFVSLNSLSSACPIYVTYKDQLFWCRLSNSTSEAHVCLFQIMVPYVCTVCWDFRMFLCLGIVMHYAWIVFSCFIYDLSFP